MSAGPRMLPGYPRYCEPTTDECATAEEVMSESDYSTSQIETDIVEEWMCGGLPDHLDDGSLWPWRKIRKANKTRRKMQGASDRGYRSENDAMMGKPQRISARAARTNGGARAQLKMELLVLKQKEKQLARYRDLLQAEYDRRCDMTASSADDDLQSLQARSTKTKGRSARPRSEPNKRRIAMEVDGAKDVKYREYRSDAEPTHKAASATRRSDRRSDTRPGTPPGSDAAEEVSSRSPSPSGSETDAPGVRRGNGKTRPQPVTAVDVNVKLLEQKISGLRREFDDAKFKRHCPPLELVQPADVGGKMEIERSEDESR